MQPNQATPTSTAPNLGESTKGEKNDPNVKSLHSLLQHPVYVLIFTGGLCSVVVIIWTIAALFLFQFCTLSTIIMYLIRQWLAIFMVAIAIQLRRQMVSMPGWTCAAIEYHFSTVIMYFMACMVAQMLIAMAFTVMYFVEDGTHACWSNPPVRIWAIGTWIIGDFVLAVLACSKAISYHQQIAALHLADYQPIASLSFVPNVDSTATKMPDAWSEMTRSTEATLIPMEEELKPMSASTTPIPPTPLQYQPI